MPQSGQHTYTGLVQLRQRGCLLQRPGPHQDCHAPAVPRSLPTEHQIQQPVQIHRLVPRNHLVRPVHPGAHLPLHPGESSLERLEGRVHRLLPGLQRFYLDPQWHQHRLRHFHCLASYPTSLETADGC